MFHETKTEAMSILPRSPLPASEAEQQLSVPIEAWDEDATPARSLLCLDAATYKPEPLFQPPKPSLRRRPDYAVSPLGTFAYLNGIIPAGYPLRLLGPQPGSVFWNGKVIVPMLIDMKRDENGHSFSDGEPERLRAAWGNVWMSLTPSEMITQRSGIKKATGNVVIGGLGLGWLLKKVCAKETVGQVIVVEKSQELLDWYGYDLCRTLPKVKDVICNDIYREITRHGDDSQFLLDIWPIFQGARLDRRLRDARRVLGDRLWAWGIN